ncbi:hypothetical protein FACS1894208_00270 [Clostridia bacterium]|nr:hypothetical protein FACS1894208_00270 [Clostridia bacterium]
MHTLNSFFCGCGGIDRGFKDAGFKIIGAWDFDKYAVASYKANIGKYVKQADVSEMTIDEVPKADVWSFGFPCTDLSVAGKQAGMEVACNACGEKWKVEAAVQIDKQVCPVCGAGDFKAANRSGLFFEIMRLLDEAKKASKRPAILMAENVKALKPLLPVLKTEYAKRGYSTYYTLLNSKYWGVAQSRERYFVVGVDERFWGRFEFSEQQTEVIPTLSDFLDAEVPERYYVQKTRARAIIGQALARLEALGACHATLTPGRTTKRQNGRRAKEDEAPMFTLTAQDMHGVIIQTPRGKNAGGVHRVHPTLTSNACEQNNLLCELVPDGTRYASALIHSRGLETRKDGISHCIKGAEGGSSKNFVVEVAGSGSYRVRQLTPKEYGRLQGFDMTRWKQVVSNAQAYRQFGNAVTVSVSRAIGEKIIEFLDNTASFI